MPGEANDPIEQIIPPEQPPMDDAAGGPQAEDLDVPVDDEATKDGTSVAESEAHPS